MKRKMITKEIPKKIGPLDAYKFKPTETITDKTPPVETKSMAISKIDNQKKV